jgi:aspartyl-tRNA synthetase
LTHHLKLSPHQLNQFHHLLTNLNYACPPHGGIALGLDRLMSILCDSSSLRDVIAFPKTNLGQDLMVGSPSTLEKQV